MEWLGLLIIVVIHLRLNPKLDYEIDIKTNKNKHCFLWYGKKDNRKYVKIY